MNAKNVMNGTDVELWIDGDLIAEATECKATASLQTTEVKMARHFLSGYKVTGAQGKGSLKMHKVSSYMLRKISESIKSHQQLSCTIVSKIDDPDAIGEERVVIKDACFDSVDIINWKVGALGEESYNFTFSDYEILDYAE